MPGEALPDNQPMAPSDVAAGGDMAAGGKAVVVLATGNRHKLREIAAMVRGEPFALVGLDSFPGIVLPPETGETFEENAIGKATAVCARTGLVAIADDSGLEVDSLGCRPGVLSARFAGPESDDQANVRLLLKLMESIPDDRRSARFVCALAIAAPNGRVEVVRGSCEGRITRAERGQSGFGYDPVFEIPADGRTLAEFSSSEKNAISHRFRAIAAALPLIREVREEE